VTGGWLPQRAGSPGLNGGRMLTVDKWRNWTFIVHVAEQHQLTVHKLVKRHFLGVFSVQIQLQNTVNTQLQILAAATASSKYQEFKRPFVIDDIH